MTRAWLHRLLRGALRLERDWRIRTLVPVLVINVAAFAGLYALMFHFAVSNIVQTRRDAASMLFDELQIHFTDGAVHTEGSFFHRLERHAAAHRLLALNLYDPAGNLSSSTARRVQRDEREQAHEALAAGGGLTQWFFDPTRKVVFFAREIPNEPSCHGCHSPRATTLGVLQTGFDLSDALADAQMRVRRKFMLAGIAWIGVLLVLVWTARVVIGRPLAQIARTIKTEDGDTRAPQDLQALANRVNDTIWGLLETQRHREQAISKHMLRAEQLAALGELAAGLTHEIKNPIAGVIAALELLRSGGESWADNRDVYDQMIAELRRVCGTVQSLLTLASPQPPKREEVDVERLVRDMSILFGARMRRQGVALEIEAAGPVPVIPLDRGLITQLVVNLLTNSIQATERGGTVRVMLAPFPRRDGVVVLVADTGRGIAADQISRVFDPFFTTKEEGTGLGLAICRQIAEQHGGTITIESEPGCGTRVMVLLPDPNAVQEEVSDGVAAAG